MLHFLSPNIIFYIYSMVSQKIVINFPGVGLLAAEKIKFISLIQ